MFAKFNFHLRAQFSFWHGDMASVAMGDERRAAVTTCETFYWEYTSVPRIALPHTHTETRDLRDVNGIRNSFLFRRFMFDAF